MSEKMFWELVIVLSPLAVVIIMSHPRVGKALSDWDWPEDR